MITLKDLTKRYPTQRGYHTVLNSVSMEISRGQTIGILGRNGSGKSTLIRLVAGAERPTSGYVRRGMRVSWPLAFTGGFQGSLTGLDNLRFVCRIYNTPLEDKLDFVRDFTELGSYLNEPVKLYSSGMRARLAFAISMCIEFDCYLIDEVVAVGDARFQDRCEEELFGKRRDRAMLIVSHNADFIRNHCMQSAVLIRGKLHKFTNVDDGLDFYHEHAAEQ